MKVTYVFISQCGTFKLGQMILPKLEASTHGAVDGVTVGYRPDLYTALSDNMLDPVIML